MKRAFNNYPGHDCIRHPCGKGACGKIAGGNHGIGDERWRWSVVDVTAQRGLSLTVSTGIFPETVPDRGGEWSGGPYPRADALVLHTAQPMTREDVLEKTYDCDLLDAGRCYTQVFSFSSSDAILARGERVEPGAAVIFERLEARLAELVKDEPTPYVRCNACDGCGTVLGSK